MSEAETLFVALRQSADDDVVDMLERMVRDAPDHALNKMNALDLAAREGIDEERDIAAHSPGELSAAEYYRQIFWSSAIDLPADLEKLLREVTLDGVDLPPGERAILSLQLPKGSLIVFDPVTHTAQFLEVGGEEASERQNLSVIFNKVQVPVDTVALHPGRLHLALENRTESRLLPAVWLANQALDDLLKRRKPILTATRLLTNQTFRDIYRTETLAIGQRLKILSLTFLFSDLKDSTALYDRVGDLVAFDLVNEHFRLLQEIIASERGAVVKTIGDAVMATFETPDRAIAVRSACARR